MRRLDGRSIDVLTSVLATATVPQALQFDRWLDRIVPRKNQYRFWNELPWTPDLVPAQQHVRYTDFTARRAVTIGDIL